jgi:myo-inositol 2-dehydrogenase / D-chiro-inositol 1-dehydrogenase
MPKPSRRSFLTTTAAATAGGVLLSTPAVHAAGNETLKLALIGVGGRGLGAAEDALAADPNVKITALCDIFPDRLETGYNLLKKQYGDRIDVPKERMFTGFDGYKQAIDSGIDVALLCTTPGFRPLHLKYAVEKGKHIFMEKPHATDATGVRSVLESVKVAKEKKLCIVSGFCYRYDTFKREMMKRIQQDKVIGDVSVIHSTYLTGELWFRGADPKWSEMEYQIRNWYYFTWLSGDFLVEQHIHNIDKIMWIMNDVPPIAATGMGGRQSRTDKRYGNVWDHFSVVYEFPGGVKAFSQCRQVNGCHSDVNDFIYGTKGTANLQAHVINPTDGMPWKHAGKHNLGNAYRLEHKELYTAIREGKVINDAERSAYSTLMGILGREAAYTGQRITWEQIKASKQDLQPKEYAWGENKVPVVPVPGTTKFV